MNKLGGHSPRTGIMLPWTLALRRLMTAARIDDADQAVTFSFGPTPPDMERIGRLAEEVGQSLVHVVFATPLSIPPRDIVVTASLGDRLEFVSGCRPFADGSACRFALLCGDTAMRIDATGRLTTVPTPDAKHQVTGRGAAMRRWGELAAVLEGDEQLAADMQGVRELASA